MRARQASELGGEGCCECLQHEGDTAHVSFWLRCCEVTQHFKSRERGCARSGFRSVHLARRFAYLLHASSKREDNGTVLSAGPRKILWIDICSF